MSRPQINLATGEKQCERLAASPDPMADGWDNQATHTFSLYFLQEKAAYEGLCKLIKKRDGRLSKNLFYCARHLMGAVYNSGGMEPMDDDYKGEPINVREIVEHVAQELGYSTDSSKPASRA